MYANREKELNEFIKTLGFHELETPIFQLLTLEEETINSYIGSHYEFGKNVNNCKHKVNKFRN